VKRAINGEIPFPYTPTNPQELSNKIKGVAGFQDAFNDAVNRLAEEVDRGGLDPFWLFWWSYKETRSYEKQVKKEEIRKDTRTTVEDGLTYTTFALYNDGKQSYAVSVPKVESVQFYDGGRVTKVTFADGRFEKAILKATTPEELEEERKEAAIAICLLKHTVAHGKYALGYGSNIYNKWMERILKQNKKAEEAKKAFEKKKEEYKERKKRIAEKKARKKERRLSRLNEGKGNK